MEIYSETKQALRDLIDENHLTWKEYIQPCCDDDDCECHTGCLTVGIDDFGIEWGYQTGNNEYHGSAYSYANWAFIWFDQDTNEVDMFDDLMCEIDSIDAFGYEEALREKEDEGC